MARLQDHFGIWFKHMIAQSPFKHPNDPRVSRPKLEVCDRLHASPRSRRLAAFLRRKMVVHGQKRPKCGAANRLQFDLASARICGVSHNPHYFGGIGLDS